MEEKSKERARERRINVDRYRLSRREREKVFDNQIDIDIT